MREPPVGFYVIFFMVNYLTIEFGDISGMRENGFNASILGFYILPVEPSLYLWVGNKPMEKAGKGKSPKASSGTRIKKKHK